MGGVSTPEKSEAEALSLREHAGLVRAVARRFEGRGAETEDLVQIGTIGLIRALRAFDPGRGCRFSTFAFPLIEGEIRDFLRRDGTVKVSRTVRQNAARLAKAAAELGEGAAADAVAAAAGLDREEAALAAGVYLPPASLTDAPEAADIPATETGYDRVLDRVMLSEGLRHLEKEEAALISLRYFRALSQEKTARVLGMTQVQVSRAEKRILAKLRSLLS